MVLSATKISHLYENGRYLIVVALLDGWAGPGSGSHS